VSRRIRVVAVAVLGVLILVLFLDRLDPQTRKQAMKEIRESEWFGLSGSPTIKVSPHPTRGLAL